MRLSIIVPTLDEAAGIGALLESLQLARRQGHELVVADGGSTDATRTIAVPLADRVIEASRGRALQMNAGAAVATGDALLFLHADTILPEGGIDAVLDALDAGALWGRFDVTIAGTHWMLPVIATMMNLRSRLTGIATGDQAMFVRRDAFVAAGGFPPIALMEDIALSRLLNRQGRPACLRLRVTTSGRRWERHGVWRTILLMWRLRLAYFLGADPGHLAAQYRLHGR